MPVSVDHVADHELERLVVRFLAGLLAVLVAGATLAVVNRIDDAPANAGRAAVASAAGLAEESVGEFIAASRNRLAGLSGQHLAIVSFVRYSTATEVDALIGAGRARRLFVAARGGTPAAIAPDDLETWARDRVRDAKLEVEEIERILPSVTSPDFARQYREDLERHRLARAELEAAIDAGLRDAALVFAFELIAPAVELRSLEREPTVRVVAAGDAPAQVIALRPEESARAGRPPVRP